MKLQIVDEMKAALQYSKIGIAMDMWLDKVKFYVHFNTYELCNYLFAILRLEQVTNVNYLGVTAHYIAIDDCTARLHSRALKLFALDNMDGPKDAEFVHNTFSQILHEFDLYDSSHQIVFITDRGKNMVNSLDGYERNSCVDHFINNIVEHMCGAIATLKTNVARIVKYLKASGKASDLSRHVPSSSPTRWSFVFNMFDAFLDVFDEIRPKIPDNREDLITKFNSINKTTLRAVRNFLEIFCILTKEVEGDTYITAVKVLPVFESLYQHLIVKNNDLAIVKRMKQIGMDYFNDNKDEVVPLHCKNWVFFHPQFKKLTNFKTVDKSIVLASIQMQIEVMNQAAADSIEIQNNNVTVENANISTGMCEKRSIFSDFEDVEQNSSENTIENEIEHYMNSKVGQVTDVLKWWMKNKTIYPNLWRYFMSFAAIPASSAAAERIFSLSHNIITVKRNRLGTDTVDMLVFLNKNKK